MKRVMLMLAALAVAAPVWARQTANDLQREMDALMPMDGMQMDMDMQGRQGAGPGQAGASTYTAPKNTALPPADPYVADALKNSPRHGEWDDIKGPNGKTIKAWVVYPESSTKTGVVLVVHEIFGLTDWVRAVADQVAADGFIAIAPDMVSGMGPNGGGSDDLGQSGVGRAIQSLTPETRAAILNAAMDYGKSMPSSNGKTGVVGFCWGGGTSLLYAIAQPNLDAAVMFYGPAPTKPGSQEIDLSGLPNIHAPILAFYPGTDARTSTTAEPISNEMKRLGKSFEYHIYDGATHGFMHQRIAPDTKAAEQSWPLAVQFFHEHLK